MLIFTDISVKFHMAYRYAGWKLSRPHTHVIRTQEVFHSGPTGIDQSWNGSVRVLCDGRHGRLPVAACWLGVVKGRNRDCGVVEDRARRAPPVVRRGDALSHTFLCKRGSAGGGSSRAGMLPAHYWTERRSVGRSYKKSCNPPWEKAA